MSYTEARRQFTGAVLPTLRALLDDPEYAAHWPKVAQLIGYLGNDPASPAALLKYLRRSDEPHWRGLESTPGYRAVLGKVEAFAGSV
jgi:hypothetical protein